VNSPSARRLRCRGQTIADRRVRGDTVTVGEDPACTFLGPAVTVARVGHRSWTEIVIVTPEVSSPRTGARHPNRRGSADRRPQLTA
jgi:hypothetical protein